jgi:hypothetical protein
MPGLDLTACHAGRVGNVTLPTSVFVAGGALCVLAGYLVGYVASPDTPDRTTADVVSFDAATSRLCLGGGSVKDLGGADAKGQLCGRWSRGQRSADPVKGDHFRFVTVTSNGQQGSAPQRVIYGSVVR